MSDYHINVFWSDEDNCYVADIPGLANCSALGDTPAHAVAELAIAREAWLDAAFYAHTPEARRKRWEAASQDPLVSQRSAGHSIRIRYSSATTVQRTRTGITGMSQAWKGNFFPDMRAWDKLAP